MKNRPRLSTKTQIAFFLEGIGFLVIGGGIFLLTAGKGITQYFFGRSFAESELKGYIASVLHQEVNGSHCQAVDKDGNGYVSCDYTLVSEPQKTHSVECAAWGWDGLLNRGCISTYRV